MNYKEYETYFFESIKAVDEMEVELFVQLLFEKYQEGRTLFVIGNGGSAATASHFAQDLAKGTRKNVDTDKRMRALSLADNIPFITALGNDDGYDTIFEQQLRTFAEREDVLIAISGSGNSPNILKAVNWANLNQVHSIGVTGFGGGSLKKICKQSLHVKLDDMCTVESIHSFLFHYIAIKLRELIEELPGT